MRSATFQTLFTATYLAIGAPLAAAEPPATRLEVDRTRSGMVAVAVTLGSERVTAALDTGATITLVSPRLAARLALTPRARSAVVDASGRERPLLVSGPVDLHWGGVDSRLPHVAWTPGNGDVPGADGLEAVLGADALAGVDALIDTGRARVWVAPMRTLAAWVDGEAIPLRPIGSRVAIEIELADGGREPLRLPLVIDSGADAPVMFGDAAATLQARVRAVAPSRLGTAGGPTLVPTVMLGRARVAGRWVRLGETALLPGVNDREEAGLLPLAALGPTLLQLASARAILDARLRPTPRPESVVTLAASR